MAHFENKSLSELMKSNTMKMLEDKYDVSVTYKVYEEYLQDKKANILEELAEDYGLSL